MNTDDLLHMLATFGRAAPAAACGEMAALPPPGNEHLREYLYCQLRENIQDSLDVIQAAWDADEAAHAAALAQKEQELATVQAQFAQQLVQLTCPVPIIPFADVTGDYATGLTISCHPGYELVGAHASCT